MAELSLPQESGPPAASAERRATHLAEAMQTAASLDAAGRATEAEARYREIVEWRPEHAPAWAALGFLAFRRGNIAEAAELTERCVALDPSSPLHWRNLCELRRRAGETSRAITAGRRAVDLAKTDPEAYHNLSLALGDANQIPEAIAVVRRLLELAPGHGRGWNNLGHWLLMTGSAEDARQAFLRALAMEPGNPEARLNLIRVDEILERRDRAASAGARRNCADRIASARRLWAEGRQQEALPILEEAAALEPDNIDALGLRATCLADLGESEAAIVDAERALGLDPANPAILMILALCQLNLGRWKEGWKNYEARFDGSDEVRSGRHVRPKLPRPHWRGETGTEGQSILIVFEQGYGDSIQFSRYLPLVSQRFARVGVLAPPGLLRLMDWTFGADIAVLSSYPTDYAGWDWYCMVMSLPFAFATEIDTLPRAPSYLRVPAPARAYWRNRLADRAGAGPKVGLSWTGRPDHRFNRARSLPFDKLEPLLAIEGVTFVSLQSRENDAVPTVPPGVQWLDWMSEMSDFAATAALVANLDLVVSIDSVIVHLAGALGIPVWLMNRRNSEWRWMAPREDSPWYPTMRIFRQPAMGDWGGVIAQVAQELRGLRDSDHARGCAAL